MMTTAITTSKESSKRPSPTASAGISSGCSKTNRLPKFLKSGTSSTASATSFRSPLQPMPAVAIIVADDESNVCGNANYQSQRRRHSLERSYSIFNALFSWCITDFLIDVFTVSAASSHTVQIWLRLINNISLLVKNSNKDSGNGQQQQQQHRPDVTSLLPSSSSSAANRLLNLTVPDLPGKSVPPSPSGSFRRVNKSSANGK